MDKLLLVLAIASTLCLSALGQTITTQPADQVDVALGSNISFTVVVVNPETFTYQWMKDGVNITDTADTYQGATTSDLTVLSVALEDEGNYSVYINGTVMSASAMLTLLKCPALTAPANGDITYSNAMFIQGTTASYSCVATYQLTGSETRTCMSNGAWSGSDSICELAVCPALVVPANGTISYAEPSNTLFNVSTVATYSCDNTFILNGTAERTCMLGGEWNGSAATCEAICPILNNPPNGFLTYSDDRRIVGTTANYMCNPGYEIISGAEVRACEANQMWTAEPPLCVRVDCGTDDLIPPDGGRLIFTNTTFGSTANYSCDPGYNINGVATRICNASEIWDPEAPTCDIVNCGNIMIPNGTVTTPGGTTFNQTATYSCDIGYELSHTSDSTCGAGGSWVPAPPTCMLVDCGTLGSPANGAVYTGDGTTFNSTTFYSCNPGYMLNGVTERTCGANGSWTGSEPTCEVAAPMITEQPVDTPYLIPGEAAMFSVVVVAVEPSYSWFLNGVVLMDSPGRYGGSNTSNLAIYNVTEADDLDIVFCIVSNVVSMVNSSEAMIRILGLPEITIPPVDTAVGLGGDVNLTCAAMSEDGMITSIEFTTMASVTLSSPTSSMSFTQTISPASIAYRGNYTCSVSNRRGTTISTAITLYVVDVQPIANQTVSTGNTVSFTCVADGAPVPGTTYRWFETINGVVVGNRFVAETFPRVSGQDTDTLTISNLDTNDIAMYTCEVTSLGEVVGTQTTNLDVITPFLIERLPSNVTLNTNDTLNISCTGQNVVGADNPLVFFWFTPVLGIVDSSGPYVTDTDLGNNQTLSRLQVPLVTTINSGVYTCHVGNTMPLELRNADISSTEVTVFFTPLLEFNFNDGRDDYRFQAGTNSQITCEVNGFPLVTSTNIVEIVNGEEVIRANSTNNRFDQMFGLSYMFTPGFNRNGREFICRATNANGNSSISTVIQVFDVPDQVNHSGIIITPVSLASVKACFTPPAPNNAPITSYRFTVCQEFCPETLDFSSFIVTDVDCVTITDLFPNYLYILRLQAMNEAGFSLLPGIDGAQNFNSSTDNDGNLVALVNSIRTDTTLVFTWELPDLGKQNDITFNRTSVTLTRPGAGPGDVVIMGVLGVNSEFTSGITFDDLFPDATYTVSIQGVYSVPELTSGITMLNTSTRPVTEVIPPLVDSVPVASINSPTTLTIRWTAPQQIDFVSMYLVNISIESTLTNRRKRQISQEIIATPDTVLVIDDPEPVANYTVGVDVQIQPPGSPSVTVPLTPPTTITTVEQAPNAPGSPMIMRSPGNPYNALDISWTLPSAPGGVLVRCFIVFTSNPTRVAIALFNIGSLPPTSHTVPGLTANTVHSFELYCVNRMDTLEGARVGVSEMTAVGVQPAAVSNEGSSMASSTINVRVRVMTGFGPVEYFQVIVSRTPLESGATSGLNILNADSPGNVEPYIAFVSTSADELVVLGNGRITSIRSMTYTNSDLLQGVNYYIFVRSFGVGGSNDSIVIFDSIPAPVPVVAIIVPIAIIAVGLLIILIVLLIFAVWKLQGPPARGNYVPAGKATGEGRRAQNIELRRTRMFAPMLNVGSPDVFTSAGQPTTLICEASGTPAPDITWTKNGEPLDKERFIQLADGSLFINDTDLQDEGEYVVSANNSAGETEQLVKVTVLRPVPPEPDEEHPPVKSGEFTEKLALLRANDDEALEDEYTEIELDWTFTSYAAKLNINKNKNRYINIIPYDHARVPLSLQDNTPGSDYINASYVDGYNAPNNYIATQGPIPSTFPDFWRMIWEMDSPTIVMVTNLKEEDKVKCHQYWPSYGTTTYGNIQVTLKEVENLAEYSIRTFTVSPLAGQSRAQMPVREVRQFHFLVWPDHGVPQYATALLTFRKRVNRYHPEKRGPMVVHCSAGVGRTGTFVTIDVCLKQIEAEANLDVFNFVRHMRFRRNYMVQTSSQYVFIHDAVLESIMCGDNSIPAPELKTKLNQLEVVNPETGLSNYASQFETLKTASPADDEFDCTVARLPDNAAKNRFKEHLPANEFRVNLSSEGDQSDYICASFLDGYRHRNNFIITQAPLEETIGDFWRMVWEQKSAAIIMLTQLEENEKTMAIKYWPDATGEPVVFGSYQIELSEDEKNKGEYITRKLKLSPIDNPQESRMVTQFHYINWTKETPPTDTHPILDLVDELQRVQRKSGNGPITVHCDDGLGRTGAFCTLYTVLERVKAEQVVDVFQAVKTLRIQRVGLMETLDEYVFVHKAVQEFLNSFSDYQNFK